MHQYKINIVKFCQKKTKKKKPAEIFFSIKLKMLPDAMHVCQNELWIFTSLNAERVESCLNIYNTLCCRQHRKYIVMLFFSFNSHVQINKQNNGQ